MRIPNQAPADLARDIARVWAAKGRPAHPRPYNRWKGDEGETWWVVPSPEWPAYHHAKIIVSASSRLVDVGGSDPSGLYVGFNVEKGVAGAAAAIARRAAWEMDDTWRWHGVLADLRAGRLRGAVSEAAQRIGGPVQVIVEAQVPVPEGSTHGFLDRVKYESRDGAELTLTKEPVIETVEKFLSALDGAATPPSFDQGACVKGSARSSRLLNAFAVLLAIALTPQAGAASTSKLAASWERTFSSGDENPDFFRQLAVQRLVDDTVLVVTQQGFGAGSIRLGPGGKVLSILTFSSSELIHSAAAADPFGSVFLVSEVDASINVNNLVVLKNDLVVMKYDGLTGRKAWPAPARISNVPYGGPVSPAIGPSGDVYVTTGVFRPGTGTIDWATLSYDGRTGAVVWGPEIYGDGIAAPHPGGPVDLAIDRAGDVVVTGFATSSDQSLWAAIKYRGSTGEQIWGPLRIGAISTAPPPTVCPSSCYSPPTFAKSAFDRKGDVFLTVSSFTAPYAQAWLTAKFDGGTGRLLWGPVSHKTGTQADFDVPAAIAVNGNGDVVVGGSVLASPYSDGGNFVNELVKYSGGTGARIWGPVLAPSTILALAFDGEGQVVVAGAASTTGLTTKFDGRSGARLWSEPIEHLPNFVVIGSDGSVMTLASGYVGFGIDQHPELQTVSYAGSNGSPLWGPVVARNEGASTWPLALLVDRSGDTVLVTISGWGPGSILKYASDGRDLWGPVRFQGGSSSTGGPAAATLDLNGDVVIARSTLVSKYSGSSGRLLWESTPIDGLDSQFTAAKTDSAGDVLMVAIFRAGWATLKFRGLTGELVWSSLYQPPFNSAQPADFGVDLKGDILVTGVWYAANAPVWTTLKYLGTTGESVWGPVLFNGTGYADNTPKRLAVDAVGDVIVTGIGASASGLSRRTFKYSGKDGAILWGPSEIAAGLIGNPDTTAIVLDGAGDVFIAGGRVPDPLAQFPREFWSLVKLDGRAGELIWGPKDFPNPTRSSAVSMAIDPTGNPIVAGTVWNGNNDEWMLVGYDSAAGNVISGPEIYDTGSNESVSQIVFAGPDFLVAGSSEGLTRTVRYGTSLGIATFNRDLAPAPGLCGTPFSGSLAASNGRAPLFWEVSGGGLPTGVDLDPFTGLLSGTLSETGSFSFRIHATDATGATAERDFTIDIVDGQPHLAITATEQDSCLPGQYTLSFPGAFASYHWLPGGETTPATTVCPFEPTIYSVTVIESNGCERRGSIELQPFRIELVPREPLVPPERHRPPATIGRAR